MNAYYNVPVKRNLRLNGNNRWSKYSSKHNHKFDVHFTWTIIKKTKFAMFLLSLFACPFYLRVEPSIRFHSTGSFINFLVELRSPENKCNHCKCGQGGSLLELCRKTITNNWKLSILIALVYPVCNSNFQLFSLGTIESIGMLLCLLILFNSKLNGPFFLFLMKCLCVFIAATGIDYAMNIWWWCRSVKR